MLTGPGCPRGGAGEVLTVTLTHGGIRENHLAGFEEGGSTAHALLNFPPCPRCRLHLLLHPSRTAHHGLGTSKGTSSASRQQHAP
jgi:hypothetical protein